MCALCCQRNGASLHDETIYSLTVLVVADLYSSWGSRRQATEVFFSTIASLYCMLRIVTTSMLGYMHMTGKTGFLFDFETSISKNNQRKMHVEALRTFTATTCPLI